MTSFSKFKDKKVGIFGLAMTGTATYKALRGKAAKLILWDDSQSNREAFATHYDAEELVELSNPLWRELDKIILSPGVPLSHDIVKIANSHSVKITSDIDLLFEEAREAKFIAVTGTNGKSTTTALIHHILKSSGLDYPMGGNIGIPALDLSLKAPGYVLELSSFQLDLIKNLSPSIAVLLNITPDHLDRHKTMAEYIRAKEKILSNLAEGGSAIIGVDNEITRDIFQNFLLKKNSRKGVPISTSKIYTSGVTIIENKIYDNLSDSIVLTLPVNKSLQGLHNKENIAASYAACKIAGIKPSKILDAVESFVGLPHRSQYLGEYRGISFYNDSKATNADATSKSLSFLDDIYWLVGGIAKEGGINSLVPYFKRIKKAYLFGQDKELFASALQGRVNFEILEDLSTAFLKAYEDAKNDNAATKNILLSPAAASYDQFRNFEHRGEVFIQLYKKVLAND